MAGQYLKTWFISVPLRARTGAISYSRVKNFLSVDITWELTLNKSTMTNYIDGYIILFAAPDS